MSKQDKPQDNSEDKNSIDVIKELSKITSTLMEMKAIMVRDKKKILEKKIEDTVNTGQRNEQKLDEMDKRIKKLEDKSEDEDGWEAMIRRENSRRNNVRALCKDIEAKDKTQDKEEISFAGMLKKNLQTDVAKGAAKIL